MLLIGDIGGTKTLLQLAQAQPDGTFHVHFEKRYASAAYDSFMPLVDDFVKAAQVATRLRPEHACFGIAGPVSGRHAVTTNLPWQISADELESRFHLKKTELINDFQAVGYGVAALRAPDLVTLQTGQAAPFGTQVVVGAGTGLGHAFLVWQGTQRAIVPSEGGHSGLAPQDDQQIALLRYLKKRYQRATWERAVSGPGLVNIFDFLREQNQGALTSALQQALQTKDQAAAISDFGLSGQDPTASEALDLFTRLYGSHAGNLALLGLATGGVLIAGGIAPKIIEKMRDGAFMQAFLDKEPHMQNLLSNIPVHVVINPNVALLGAAVVASR